MGTPCPAPHANNDLKPASIEFQVKLKMNLPDVLHRSEGQQAKIAGSINRPQPKIKTVP